MTLEFAVGTLMYERASQLSLQDDEARRLAEHLVIARKLLTEQLEFAPLHVEMLKEAAVLKE